MLNTIGLGEWDVRLSATADVPEAVAERVAALSSYDAARAAAQPVLDELWDRLTCGLGRLAERMADACDVTTAR
jgi:hypothetical protein